MFRFGDDLFFVGEASCARTSEEGRLQAFEDGLKELRNYAQGRDTSGLFVETQMVYEEPRSSNCPAGTVSVWRLLRANSGKVAALPKQRPASPSETTTPSAPTTTPPPAASVEAPLPSLAPQDLTPQIGMTRGQIIQRFGEPQSTRKKGRQEIWEYPRTGLTVVFSPDETLLSWTLSGPKERQQPESPPPLSAKSQAEQPEPESVRTAPPPPVPAALPPVDKIAEGRWLFNGKGNCYTCHGRDADTITGLDPQALSERSSSFFFNPFTFGVGPMRRPSPDLRKWSDLNLRTDLDMSRAIREGIGGTTMGPSRHLTDAEISAIVAYLNELRRQ